MSWKQSSSLVRACSLSPSSSSLASVSVSHSVDSDSSSGLDKCGRADSEQRGTCHGSFVCSLGQTGSQPQRGITTDGSLSSVARCEYLQSRANDHTHSIKTPGATHVHLERIIKQIKLGTHFGISSCSTSSTSASSVGRALSRSLIRARRAAMASSSSSSSTCPASAASAVGR